MRRVIRLALLAAVVAGCGPSKQESPPNPNLEVPVVPAGGHGSKAAMKDLGKKK